MKIKKEMFIWMLIGITLLSGGCKSSLKEGENKTVITQELLLKQKKEMELIALQEKAIKEAANLSPRERLIRTYFDSNGNHIALTKRIKKKLYNHESILFIETYKHIETAYRDKGSYLLLRTLFSIRNEYRRTEYYKVMSKVSAGGKTSKFLKIISTEEF